MLFAKHFLFLHNCIASHLTCPLSLMHQFSVCSDGIIISNQNYITATTFYWYKPSLVGTFIHCVLLEKALIPLVLPLVSVET